MVREGRTVVEDQFVFESPFGVLGRIFDWWILRRVMIVALEARLQALESAVEGEGAARFLGD